MADSNASRENRVGLLRFALFFIILTPILLCVNGVLEPKYYFGNALWPTTSSYAGFYQMDHDSVDVLFFGSSYCVNSFNPQQLYDEYGIRSYNLGSEQQSAPLSYWWLREALEYQSPKIVVLETRYLFDHDAGSLNMIEGMVRKTLDPMRLSPNKIAAVSQLCALDPTYDAKSFYLTNLRFHTRWKQLGQVDFDRSMWDKSPLKGYAPTDFVIEHPFVPFDSVSDAREEPFHPVMKDYLDKMVDLCNAKGTGFVLVTIPDEFSVTKAQHNALAAYAKRRGIPFYDFTMKDLYDSLGITSVKENATYHQNVAGSIKFNRRFGQILRDELHIEPVDDMQWSTTAPYWQNVQSIYSLKGETDATKWARMLQAGDYTLFTVTNGDVAAATAQQFLTEAFASRGIDPRDMHADGCTVREPSNMLFDPEHLEGTVENARFRYVLTSTKQDDAVASIKFDGATYRLGNQGILMLVYDRQLTQVADVAQFAPKDNRWVLKHQQLR